MKRPVFEPVPPDACDSRGVAGKGVPGGRAAGGAARRAVAGWRSAGVRGREGSGETSPGRRAGRPAAGARGSVTLSTGKARRCGPTGTAPAPPEARTYPAGIAGECQSRRGDSVSAGSEVAPGRGAAGRGSEGVPPSRAANRPAILRAGRRYPRRRRRRGRGGMPERLEGERGGNSPRASTRVGSGGCQAAPLRPLSCGRGRRRLAGGPSHLRPLSCGRGPAGWKGPVRRIRRISRPRTAGPAGAATPATGERPGSTDAGTRRPSGQRGLHAPRYPARGAGRCRRRSARPLSCGRAPPVGRGRQGGTLRESHRRPSAGVHRNPERSRAFPGGYPAAVRGGGGSPSGVSARHRCRVPRRYPAAAAPARGSRPLLRPLSCGRGGGDRVCGLF
jgi:hypothetical protein